jgi:CRISPR-associated protein Cmr1
MRQELGEESMKELTYQARFITPAFLGNAEQQAQWRTPPIKALIRQWWRVAQAGAHGYDHAKLRQAEMRLFGAASDDGSEKSHRSLLRLRLSSWSAGALTSWPTGGETVSHPEVKNQQGNLRPVGAELYLGYGPLGFRAGGTALNQVRDSEHFRSAIDDKAKATLRLMLPDGFANEIETALQLAAWFGTLGSRSRNAWGALHLAHAHLQPLDREHLQALGALRPLADCLREEWPHAVGSDADDVPLVWKTAPVGSWRDAIKALAKIKIAFRTHFAFTNGGPGATLDKRHVLAYPVTNHNVPAWGGQERLANQIRFKVHSCAGGKFEGVIVHLPCKVPDELVNKLAQKDQTFIRSNELKVWQAVHQVLDHNATRLA